VNALRIRKRLDAPIPQLPELAPMIGKTVEIIVIEESVGEGNGAAQRPATLEEIAAAQRVQPVSDPQQLSGGWPEDERDDGFDEALEQWRRSNVVRPFKEE
jgi:hypothetical protein